MIFSDLRELQNFPELKFRYGCKSATWGCRGKEFPLTSRYAAPDRPAFAPPSRPP